jgi:PAS domain S-box-containing protein
MPVDYQLAFDLAPIGLVLSRHRTMVDCNQRVCEMFGVSKDQLVGQSFQLLYPSADEYERTGARLLTLLGKGGAYADDRMRQAFGLLKI